MRQQPRASDSSPSSAPAASQPSKPEMQSWASPSARTAETPQPARPVGQPVAHERAGALGRPPAAPQRRRGHHADRHLVPLLEGQQRRPHRDPAHVVLGPVDRVDDPAPPALGCFGRAVLLAHDRVAGRATASRSRRVRSTAVSASVTGVRSGLVSTTRSAARKRAARDRVGHVGELERQRQVLGLVPPRPVMLRGPTGTLPAACRHGRPPARDHRPPARAGPLQHRQPAGQRAAGDRVPRRLPARRGLRDRAARRRRGPAEPGRGPGARTAPATRSRPLLPRPRRHGAGRPVRVEPRSLVRRGRRRLPLGPRRARHEVPGGRRGGRGRVPGPRRLAAGRGAP